MKLAENIPSVLVTAGPGSTISPIENQMSVSIGSLGSLSSDLGTLGIVMVGGIPCRKIAVMHLKAQVVGDVSLDGPRRAAIVDDPWTIADNAFRGISSTGTLACARGRLCKSRLAETGGKHCC